MAKKRYINLIFTNCPDPKRREEFERWYMHTHLVDLKGTKGLVRARRFKNRDPKDEPSQTVTLYEFETDDIDASIAELQNTATMAFTKGRHIDIFDLKGMYLYEEIDPKSLKPLTQAELDKYPKG
jgi:hypothetical protein